MSRSASRTDRTMIGTRSTVAGRGSPRSRSCPARPGRARPASGWCSAASRSASSPVAAASRSYFRARRFARVPAGSGLRRRRPGPGSWRASSSTIMVSRRRGCLDARARRRMAPVKPRADGQAQPHPGPAAASPRRGAGTGGTALPVVGPVCRAAIDDPHDTRSPTTPASTRTGSSAVGDRVLDDVGDDALEQAGVGEHRRHVSGTSTTTSRARGPEAASAAGTTSSSAVGRSRGITAPASSGACRAGCRRGRSAGRSPPRPWRGARAVARVHLDVLWRRLVTDALMPASGVRSRATRLAASRCAARRPAASAPASAAWRSAAVDRARRTGWTRPR